MERSSTMGGIGVSMVYIAALAGAAIGYIDSRPAWDDTGITAGALFCDRRYDTVFTYHNGAESYYAARGFRCALRV